MASCFDFPANVARSSPTAALRARNRKSVLHRDYPRRRSGCFFPSAVFFYARLLRGRLHDASTLDAVRSVPDFVHHGFLEQVCPCEMTKAYAACTSEELILVDSAEHGKSYLVEKGPRGRGALPLSCGVYRVKEDSP